MPSHDRITLNGPLVLASRSPRRRAMLAEAGFAATPIPADLDDGDLIPPGGVCPRIWVMALAYFKARRVAWLLDHPDQSGIAPEADTLTILAADTVCAHAGAILGQPPTADAASSMINAMQNDEHHTLSGVCILPWRRGQAWAPSDGRFLLVDSTAVRVGALGKDRIAAYVEGGEWRGKAGGYNLSERIEDGWPIETVGDPTTVMGLPMRRLERVLESIETS